MKKKNNKEIQNQFMSLREAMSRLFDESFLDPLAASPTIRNVSFPKVEIKENENNITVKAEIPGIDPKDVDIEVSDDTLSISGETQREAEDESDRMYRSEIRYGTFSRTFRLPDKIDTDTVSADAENGIIMITLPKKDKKSKKKKVKIKK